MATKKPIKNKKKILKRKKKLFKKRYIIEDDYDFSDEKLYNSLKRIRKQVQPKRRIKKTSFKKPYYQKTTLKQKRYLKSLPKQKIRKKAKPSQKRITQLDRDFTEFANRYRKIGAQTYSDKKKVNQYQALLRDYRAKNKAKKRKVTKLQEKEDMTQILKNLFLGQRLRALGFESKAQEYFKKALKKTTRRDGLSDQIPVGESPKNEGVDTTES